MQYPATEKIPQKTVSNKTEGTTQNARNLIDQTRINLLGRYIIILSKSLDMSCHPRLLILMYQVQFCCVLQAGLTHKHSIDQLSSASRTAETSSFFQPDNCICSAIICNVLFTYVCQLLYVQQGFVNFLSYSK